MSTRHLLLTAILLLITSITSVTKVHAQYNIYELINKEFRLERKSYSRPSGQEFSVWMLCLNNYRVMISGQKRYIPIFPIYTASCFKSHEARAIDVLERASNALDCLLHGESLEIYPSPKTSYFRGFAIWTMPMDLTSEHPGLVFRIDEADVPHFGFRADSPKKVATYVRDIFEAMRTLFIKHSDPSKCRAINYPYVKILKRIWLDARQHTEKIRNVPPEISAQSVNEDDIQEAIDMLSESQRLRLLGIALMIPEEM